MTNSLLKNRTFLSFVMNVKRIWLSIVCVCNQNWIYLIPQCCSCPKCITNTSMRAALLCWMTCLCVVKMMDRLVCLEMAANMNTCSHVFSLGTVVLCKADVKLLTLNIIICSKTSNQTSLNGSTFVYIRSGISLTQNHSLKTANVYKIRIIIDILRLNEVC